jgi:hypothetical protein
MDVVKALASLANVDQAQRGGRSLQVVSLGSQGSHIPAGEELLHLLDCVLCLVAPGPNKSFAELSRRVGLVKCEDLAEGVHVLMTGRKGQYGVARTVSDATTERQNGQFASPSWN